MVFTIVIGDDCMECRAYYPKGKSVILLRYANNLIIEIEYMLKTYSSLNGSYVVFCYPSSMDFDNDKTKQALNTVNLYHDDEKVLDSIICDALTMSYVDLQKYYEETF
ncbi:hypothetical protein [Youngiibacter multivorans]|uniref:Uncharacterized protein n=1 Tax=Youngiibacter multivorans TaxID=937251 RepID=A0ABS4G791_9CLOT|nr:hypothetical protein [Youngiibacter multivorans]MBP1920419.1 hypothetical protein [Youngiibacter multivorans]